ncbi:MAG: IreB family regulatory phosphoprotein [Firmicutes bacterium]|nr:IreB family regulatory phosphoprotein [Bacillota bacterium]
MMFRAVESERPDLKAVLQEVYEALRQKGYNPLDQLVGYLMTGDPAYITSHNNARMLIKRIDRDELLETLLRNYLQKEN